MSSRSAFLGASLAALVVLYACSSKPQSAEALTGDWGTEANGMTWRWNFAQDNSFTWKILGQTDMGGRPVDIEGRGSYLLKEGHLLLSFDRFGGLPGILRSGDAAPGFDAKTSAALRFAGKDRMVWKFESAALGPQELELARTGGAWNSRS